MIKGYLRIFIFAILGWIALTSCHEDSQNTLSSLSIAQIKLTLANAKSDNNLITKIEVIDHNHALQFENGNALLIQSKWIEKIVYDSAHWLATFHFRDGEIQVANFLGVLNPNEIITTLNPFLASPLTAIIKLETPVNGKFKITVKGKPSGGVSIERLFDYYSIQHELSVLGLYENHNNQVELVFLNQQNQYRCAIIINVAVPAIDNKPDLNLQILTNQLSQTYDGLYMVFNQRIGFDQTGEIRWYYNGEGANFFGKLKNGNFISGSTNNLSFYEVTMLGQTVKKYMVPNALHHEILEMPSGNFLVATHSPPGPPYEDVVVEIGRATGAIVKWWDFNFILDPKRATLPDTQPGDWLHINAMYYDEGDKSIVVSARSQSAVIKIDYATGAVKWILGNHNYWNETLQSFLLKPIDENGNELDSNFPDFWPYGQHAIQKTSSGNFLMYDNGIYRGFYDNPNVPQNSYTRLVEYQINDQAKTIRLKWHFDLNKSLFTKYTGYVQELPTSQTRLGAFLWSSENTPRILEIDAANQVIFEIALKQSNTPYYRALKTDLYLGL